MRLLITIAWRNLWRNPRRSLILISAIMVCIVALMFTLGYINGILRQMVTNSVEFHLGEMEIYKNGFNDDHDPVNHISSPGEILDFLGKQEGLAGYSPRVEGRGLASSSYASSGVRIIGIDPSSEAKITLVARSVIEGDYLESGGAQGILIGRKMSEKLKLGLGDKMVLTVQTVNGELAADAYRVVGIFKTISSDFDKYMVYLPIASARQLLEIDSGITGIVMRLADRARAAEIQGRIKERFKSHDIEVLSWEELEPLIAEMVRISKKWNLIFFVAVFIVLSIGIINTQNIAVYERMHELGVLKAMGTGPLFIFSMVMMETFFLGLVGITAGFCLSFPVILYFSISGLNLAMFSEGMEMFGLGARIYFEIEPFDIIFCSLSILATAFFGSFFPALRASRLEPVRAIRYS